MTHDPTSNGMPGLLSSLKALRDAPALAWVSVRRPGDPAGFHMFIVEPMKDGAITDDPVWLTQDFSAPGVISLMAHGRQEILDLKAGDQVKAYAEGPRLFKIVGSRSFEVTGTHPLRDSAWVVAHRSIYKSLWTDQAFTHDELYPQIYGGAWPLVLSTCIARPGNPGWGRRYVFAERNDR